ncbi:MAG: glycosyltransferase [Clostridia bacterium]|nr:glycosyltransferase [Clostridia bacterium]
MSLKSFLLITQTILFYLLMFFWIYQLFICLFAFLKEKKKPKIIDKHHKFMAVIAARNEERVIREAIKSLKNQTYDNLDIYVIADNCTDNTARDAKFEGAIVYERTDPTKRRKGYALEWFLDRILKEKPDEYDVFCVFDADNIVKEDFFEKMNEKFCEGEEIVQGYRDIRNPR